MENPKVSMLLQSIKMKEHILTQLSMSKKKTGRASCPWLVAIVYISGMGWKKYVTTFQTFKPNGKIRRKKVYYHSDCMLMSESPIQRTKYCAIKQCKQRQQAGRSHSHQAQSSGGRVGYGALPLRHPPDPPFSHLLPPVVLFYFAPTLEATSTPTPPPALSSGFPSSCTCCHYFTVTC